MDSIVSSAIDHSGLTKVGNRFGIQPSAVQKWRDRGFLPESELSGRTQYSAGIAEMSDGKYTEEQLLAATRAAWLSRTVKRGRRKRIRRPA